MRRVSVLLVLAAALALAGCAARGQFRASLSTAGLTWHSETDFDLTRTAVAPRPEEGP